MQVHETPDQNASNDLQSVDEAQDTNVQYRG